MTSAVKPSPEYPVQQWERIEKELTATRDSISNTPSYPKPLTAASSSFQVEMNGLYVIYRTARQEYFLNVVNQRATVYRIMKLYNLERVATRGAPLFKELQTFNHLKSVQIRKNYPLKLDALKSRIDVLTTDPNPPKLTKEWWKGIEDLIPK